MLTMVSELSTPARVGLVAAGLVVAVGLGAGALANQPGPNVAGPAPSASALPSETPALSPMASPVNSIDTGLVVPCAPTSVQAHCLAAGTYALSTIDAWPATITLDIPSGWSDWDPGPGLLGLLVDKGEAAPDGSGWGVVISTVGEVPRDPCDPSAGSFPAEDISTPEDLAAAMASWPNFSATPAAPVTFDGTRGVVFDLTIEASVGCPAEVLWTSTLGTSYDGYPMTAGDPGEFTGRYRVVDVDGDLVLMVTTEFAGTSPHELSQGVVNNPDRHTNDLPEMQAIVESLRFREQN
jgi:hypothetical protein